MLEGFCAFIAKVLLDALRQLCRQWAETVFPVSLAVDLVVEVVCTVSCAYGSAGE